MVGIKNYKELILVANKLEIVVGLLANEPGFNRALGSIEMTIGEQRRIEYEYNGRGV